MRCGLSHMKIEHIDFAFLTLELEVSLCDRER